MWTIHNFDSLESTQDTLKTLPDAHEGSVVKALEQTSGKGRHGREWSSPKGNLYFSYLIKPKRPIMERGTLALLSGLGMHQAIGGDDVMLKWPNDILMAGKKCAGILCEMQGDDMIIGIGVNIASPPEGAASIGKHHEPDQFLQRYLDRFASLYSIWQKHGFAPFKQEWLNAAHKEGAAISIKQADEIVSGTFAGISDYGALLLQRENGDINTILSGELYVASR